MLFSFLIIDHWSTSPRHPPPLPICCHTLAITLMVLPPLPSPICSCCHLPYFSSVSPLPHVSAPRVSHTEHLASTSNQRVCSLSTRAREQDDSLPSELEPQYYYTSGHDRATRPCAARPCNFRLIYAERGASLPPAHLFTLASPRDKRYTEKIREISQNWRKSANL